MLFGELADRSGGRLDPRGCDRVEESGNDGFLQAFAAEGLACFAGGVQVTATHACIAVAALAGIGDLHPSPAAPAAHEALQQCWALARGAACLTPTGHVRSQPLARSEVFIPTDIARMVIW